MQVRGRNVGICSWSLHTTDEAEIIKALATVGLTHVQLNIGPYLDGANTTAAAQRFAAAGITITAGMIGFDGEDYATIDIIRNTGGFLPDDLAFQRVERAIAAGRVARSAFELDSLSTHAGFLPPVDSPKYPVVQERIRSVADAFADLRMTLLFETGQETAAHLKHFLDDLKRPNVKANFDPGNMILYGAGDPVAAIRTLGHRIGHVHVKDAVGSDRPGEIWGKEVAPGNGQVDWPAFLGALDEVGYRGPLVIEREVGPDRVGDIRQAVKTLQSASAVAV